MSAIPLPDPPLRDAGTGIALRPWGTSSRDPDDLAAAWSDEVIAAQTRPPEDRSTAAATRWIAGETIRRNEGMALDLVIVDVSPRGRRGPESPVLGEVGLAHLDEMGRAEIGFWLVARARGRGVATVAVGLVTRWALSEEGFRRRQLWARTAPENEAAGGVLSRAGYRRLGQVAGRDIWSIS